MQGIKSLHNDAVVVTLNIVNYNVYCILVDNGSSTDVLFYDAFWKIGFTLKWLGKLDSPLVGFFEDDVPIKGIIILLIMVGQAPRHFTVQLDFLVLRVFLAYHAILGQLGLNMFWVVISTYHLLVKFPTKYGIGKTRGDQTLARVLYGQHLRSGITQCSSNRGIGHPWWINQKSIEGP